MVEDYEILWDKAIQLEKENPEKAIEYYEQALELNEHPFIYTNIAACYDQLKEYKKSEYWYKKGESSLLQLDDRYSGNPYANYAWFLFSQKKNYEKALRFSEISIQVEPESALFLENHTRILIALKKKDEFIPYLAKLRLTVPDWDSVQDLLKKYKGDIDNYWKDYWNVSDKYENLENRLLLHEIEHKLILAYVNGKSRKIPDIKHDNWTKLFKDLLVSNIEITDEIFVKLFKILIKREEYDKLLLALTHILEKTHSGYNLMFKLLKNAGVKKSTVVAMILKYITDESENDLDIISQQICPSYKRQLKTWYEESEDFKLTVKYIKLMIRNNYEYFKDDIMKYLSHNLNDKNFSRIIATIPDRDDRLILLAKKHESWLNELKVGKSFKKLVISYLSNKKVDLSKDLISDFLRIEEGKLKNYWVIFTKNFMTRTDSLWDKKLLSLSFLFSPYNTLKSEVGFEGDAYKVVESLKTVEIELSFYLKFLLSELLVNKHSEDLFIQFTKSNFNLIVSILKTLSIKSISQILPIIVKYNRVQSFDVLMSYSVSSSKIIRKTIEVLLYDYPENYDEIVLLVGSKKMDTRVLGINLILYFKKKGYREILDEILLKEKSKTVKTYLESKINELE